MVQALYHNASDAQGRAPGGPLTEEKYQEKLTRLLAGPDDAHKRSGLCTFGGRIMVAQRRVRAWESLARHCQARHSGRVEALLRENR